MPRALIVEDDENSLEGLAALVAEQGFEVAKARSVDEARDQIASDSPAVALLDLQLPDGTGLDLLEQLRETPDVEIVMITAHGTIDSAVEALQRGAGDYLTKPVDLSRLKKILDKVQETIELREQVVELRSELRRLGRFGPMIGASRSMQTVYDLVLCVAPTPSTVLITGETGVGKELVARLIHDNSPRARRPFVAVNCSAVAPTLIESELFGHEKGSFTGAERRRKGIFEQADGGTLLLDEITEMSVELQAKLLRVLETSTFTRIGGDRPKKVDVRVIAATNRDPEKAAREGQLREDLLYRLNVFPIPVPPLRERGDDVELLAQHLLSELNARAETSKKFTDAALETLRSYSWPGNVRELKNIVERAFILAGETIDASKVPLDERKPEPPSGSGVNVPIGTPIASAERELILATLKHAGGSRKEAARMLGISVKTLYNRLREYGESTNPDEND